MTPKKSKPKPDDKEQSARFIKTAGQIQSDNPKEAFDEAISKIAKKKQFLKIKPTNLTSSQDDP